MKRRILSIVAALALALGTIAVAQPAAADIGYGDRYVAFGDSEAAGTGNLFYVEKAPCYRSRISYPLILRGTSSACAGATTADVTDQVAEAIAAGDLGPGTTLVTVTAGINDLDWQTALTVCFSNPDPAACAAVWPTPADFAAVGPGLVTALSAIKAQAPHAKLLVTGYPRLFGAVSGTGCSIGWVAGGKVVVTPDQAALANLGVDTLNGVIAGAAAYVGATYIDVATAFAGHSLCDTRTPWINGVIGFTQIYEGSLHINAAGQYALAAVVWRAR